MIGIVPLGDLTWLICHLKGWRKFYTAIIAGATMSFVSAFAYNTHSSPGFSSNYGDAILWKNGVITQFGLSVAFYDSLKFAMLGALIGFVTWRIAYRKFKPLD